jgi:hypothetical protein
VAKFAKLYPAPPDDKPGTGRKDPMLYPLMRNPLNGDSTDRKPKPLSPPETQEAYDPIATMLSDEEMHGVVSDACAELEPWWTSSIENNTRPYRWLYTRLVKVQDTLRNRMLSRTVARRFSTNRRS